MKTLVKYEDLLDAEVKVNMIGWHYLKEDEVLPKHIDGDNTDYFYEVVDETGTMGVATYIKGLGWFDATYDKVQVRAWRDPQVMSDAIELFERIMEGE